MTSAPGIPTAANRRLLLGHLIPLLRDPLAFLSSLPAHGDVVRIWLGPISALVVCDPDLTQYVLRHDRVFDKGGLIFQRAREAVGDGLPTCPYSRHRRQRRLLQPSFHPTRMPNYAPVMAERIAAVADSWRDGQVLDVKAEMTTLTSSTIMAALFSGTVSDTILSQSLDDMNAVVDGAFQRALMPPPLDRIPTPGNRAFRRAGTRLHDNFTAVIADHRSDGIDHGNLLSTLLAARDTDGRGLTDTEVCEQIMAFFIAGTETTATTLTWALYLLDQHPDIAEQLYAEVDAVLAGRPACYADLPNLELTGRIITETLRVRGPIWFFTRVVSEDTELGEHHLPAGTNIVYSPYLIHHRADLYPEPERFDPERWTPATGTQLPRGALIPFGAGARKCIGDSFAMTESTLALATIFARWRLDTLPHQRIRLVKSAVLRPRRLLMRVTARNTVAIARQGRPTGHRSGL